MVTIGVDARAMMSRHPRGIGRTLARLYRELVLLAPQWQFYFYTEPYRLPDFSWDPLPANVKLRPIGMPGSRWNLWQDVRLPLTAWIDGVSLLHCPAQTAPRWCPIPFVTTIHDIIPLRMNDGVTDKAKRRLESNLRHTLRNATRIICISEYTRIDLLNYFDDERPPPVDVIHWAPEFTAEDHKPGQLEAICAKYEVKRGSFFLALGGEAPRKNTAGLLDAFRYFCEKNESWDLLIIGLQESVRQQWYAQVQQWPCARRIHLYGYAPENEMPLLYTSAGAFVFPSLYEGFGVPLLDAMACGCPIIASNCTSITEIMGDAAIFFDPKSNMQMVKVLMLVQHDTALRRTLSGKAITRLKCFSWPRTASNTQSTINSAILSSRIDHPACN